MSWFSYKLFKPKLLKPIIIPDTMDKSKDFGDFEEVKEENPNQPQSQELQGFTRVRMPRGKELIGVIVQRLGGNRMEVKTTDGKTRNCRVPGRYRRKLWLRPKDVVMIVPWDFEDSKGDVIYKYSSSEITQLNKKGIMASLKSEF